MKQNVVKFFVIQSNQKENFFKKFSYLALLLLTKSLLRKLELTGFDFDIAYIAENRTELEKWKSCIFDPFEWVDRNQRNANKCNLLQTVNYPNTIKKGEFAMKMNSEENNFGIKICLAINFKKLK